MTEKAGVGEAGYGLGVAVGDYDNDGWPDLYVSNFGPNVLYRNNGDGTFTDVTAASGIGAHLGYGMGTVCFDFDNDGDTDTFLGLLARQVGDSQKAVGYLRKVFAADPKLADTQLCLGDSLLSLGDAKEAIAVLEQGDGVTRFGTAGQFVLGQAYFQSGDFGKARQCYEAAVRLDPRFSNAHYGLAKVLARLGQEEKAREHFKIVTRLREEFLSAGGRPSGADDVQRDAAELRDKFARCYLMAAEVYRRQGQDATMAEYLRRAQALGLRIAPPGQQRDGESPR